MDLPKRLKKLAERQKPLYIAAYILCVVLIIGALWCIYAVNSSNKNEKKADYLLDASYERQYCYVDVSMMSYEFAEYEANANHQLFFVLDGDVIPYVVCMDKKELEKYQAAIDFTYDQSGEATEPQGLRIYGYACKFDDELRDEAIESFNYFWGSDVVNKDNFGEFFGLYYLDSTISNNDSWMGFLLIAVIAAIVLAALVLTHLRINQATKRTLNQMTEYELAAVEQQSVHSDAVHDKKRHIIETEDYRINYHKGLIIQRKSQIGEEAVSAQENGGLKIDYDTNSPEEKKPNRILGIIGAIGGALLGAVVWAVIGKVGYIAGIAGYLIVFLALKGYHLLAGRLDRAGAVISVIIGFVMIVPANYVTYVWAYLSAVYSDMPQRVDIIYTLEHFPDIMAAYDIWPDFIRDLVIGYILSVFASFSLIRSLLRKQK